MRYNLIRKCDVANGDGIGVSVFIQGCPNPHCKGCFNPETWDFYGGKEWTNEIENIFFELIKKPYIRKIAFLGGECLCDENINDITKLVKKCKKEFPNKSVWLWSRYNFEKYISKLEIINYLDYVIDGEYVEELKNFSLKHRGSSNQNIWKRENSQWTKCTEEYTN